VSILLEIMFYSFKK